MTTFRSFLPLTLLLGLAACGGDESNTTDAGAETQNAALTDMPCEVKSITDKYCSTCHGAMPIGGAPMSLVTQADFQKNATNGVPLHQRIVEKLSDKAAPMPPVGRPQLTPAELVTLTHWLEGGAQKLNTAEACDTSVDAGANPDVQYYPPDIPDSECEVIIEIRAHGGATIADTSKFNVQPNAEHYQCFYFEVPYLNKMQILKFEPIIDNSKVLHHFLLYQENGIVAPNGSSQLCEGSHPTAALLTGWAPGSFGSSMPPDVGLQTASGPNTQFNMEIHYNNSTSSDVQPDASGVRICATSKLRKNEAAAHWLGTELILEPPGKVSTARSSCLPTKTAHVLSTSPHMHRTGKHMSSIVTHADGGVEAITDRDFSFADQRIYPVGGAAGEMIINPGDRIDTTCTYENDTNSLITFGSLTSQEMCYNFVVAWPVGSLETGGLLVDGPNRCMR